MKYDYFTEHIAQKRDRKLFHQKLSCLFLAGPAGFEPSSAAVKVLCLTAWRWPNGLYNSKCQIIISDFKKKSNRKVEDCEK